MKENFKKFDQNKRNYALLPTSPIGQLQDVLDYGAKKYAPNNWRKARGRANLDRYYSACLRHLFAYREGILNDDESGLSHLAHAMCNIMFLMELEPRYHAKRKRRKGR